LLQAVNLFDFLNKINFYLLYRKYSGISSWAYF
jgi:hypothetical protein